MYPPLLVFCFFYYRHRIQRDVSGMLLLLLLLLHQEAAARVPLHEYLHGEDYGYVEAYSRNQENQPQHRSDYNRDNNTEDSYEYKEDLDDNFRSEGGVDSEVNAKPKYLCLPEMPLWQKRH